jgi:hypothetical protein
VATIDAYLRAGTKDYGHSRAGGIACEPGFEAGEDVGGLV